MAEKRTTIYSIGKLAGVSPSTVSKALSNSGKLSEEMRLRIQRIAADMDFKPRLVRRKSPCIGILIQQHPNHPLDFGLFLARVAEGVCEYSHDEGLTVSMMPASVDELNRMDLIREFSKRNIDAAVLLRCTEESDYIGQLEKSRFPYCILNGSHPLSSQRGVVTDFESIGRMAGEHLRDNGHIRVGIIVSPSAGISGQLRLRGFLQVFPDAEVILDEELHVVLGFEAGRVGVERLLRRNPALTAIFATGYEPAQGALFGLRQAGKRVPEDVSVISCDDYPAAAYLNPPLTTIAAPIKRLGNFAARQVYRALRGLPLLEPETHLQLHGELVVRESVRSLND